MGLGIPKSDQPFIRDGNICKGVEINRHLMFHRIVIHQSRCVKHFLGYRIVMDRINFWQLGWESVGLNTRVSFGPR